jgi:Zn-dependent M32 family carboxypeptidase
MKTEDWIELRRRASELQEIRSVLGLLAWDQETQLPPKGGQARGRQVATLEALERNDIAKRSIDARKHAQNFTIEILPRKTDKLDAKTVALDDLRRVLCQDKTAIHVIAEREGKQFDTKIDLD